MGAFFVGAELNAGDGIPPLDTVFNMEFHINETIYKNYLGFRREVNHMEARFTDGMLNVHVNAYWDRETGIETEVSTIVSSDLLGGSLFASHSYTLIDTNATIPELPPFLILPLFMIATMVVAVIIYRRQIK